MATSVLRAAATAGRLSRSTTVVMGAESANHVFRVKGYSRAKEIPNVQYMTLGTIDVGGHSWSLHYYPNGKTLDTCRRRDDTFAIQCDVSVAAVEPAGNGGLAGVAPPPLPPAVVALPESDLQKDLAELLWSKLGTDVTIEVGGEAFHAHKCMLAARSPEFREKFFGGSTQRKTAVVHNIQIDDMGPEKDLAELLWSKQGADVTIEVGGETFHAHKWLLAVRSSPEFKDRFFGPATQKKTAATTHIHIQIDDIEPQVFKSLLHFMYTDTLPKIDDEETLYKMATGLLAAAGRYKIEKLKEMCEEVLCERVDMSTVEASLALCEQHHCPALRAACMEFLAAPENLKAIVAEDGLLQRLNKSCQTVLMEIFMKKLAEREAAEAAKVI
ncbi:unnamed protein product [Urochloa decumbens]|uniref:BTB domain-containing protein n=1 Tax=Urochloa decumbens TaxID=240449 RepID=A0ABC9DQ78_9POAL